MYPNRTILPRTHDEIEALRVWFWSRVCRWSATDCWEWRAAIEGAGYGYATIGRQPYKAHRLAWELSRGPIPDGLLVLHRCDNRRCVRPNHLFLGTARDNMRDMWRKGRQGRIGKRGELSHLAKLTADDVRAIRALAATGVTQSIIARGFGIEQSNVSMIVRRETWAHL